MIARINRTRSNNLRNLCAVAIGVFLMNSMHSSAERVLCVGDDGHVSVESAIAGSCADTRENNAHGIAHAQSERVGVQDAGHCGPCEDMPIVVDGDVAYSVRFTIPNSHAPVAALAIATQIEQLPTSAGPGAFAERHLGQPAPLKFLRSVSQQR